ncbi:Uncharacterised protein [Legionella moravica]|uniref:Uncharacterized protein n=1 Tax=Legionella moravica TaxID=39962 RepID=A0A378JTD0_9GAMM|nr:Uncharacterised protein [Legionella moravica]
MKKEIKIQPSKLTEYFVPFIIKHQVVLVAFLLFYIIYSNFAFET